ncbi:MAG: DUF805 domain-containing protein [Oceanicaulis sp.]
MDWTKVLFDPNGRIGQREFWIGVLIIVVGNIVAGFIPFLGFIISLGLIWVGIAVYGKRLHDAGKTAWLHAVPWALNILLFIIALVMIGGALFNLILNSAGGAEPSDQDIIAMVSASGGGFLVLTLGFLVWVAYTIWVGVLKGDPGANQYGPAPVIEGAAAPAAPAAEDTTKG